MMQSSAFVNRIIHLLPVKMGSGGVYYAQGVLADRWVFVSGLLATDFVSGLAPNVIHPKLPLHGEPKAAVEAKVLLNHAEEVLKAAGSDFQNVVRIDQFYSNWSVVDHYQQIRRQYFGNYIPPSTSILEEGLLLPGAEMDVSMIAIVPSPEFKIEPLNPPEIEVPARAGFSPIVCVGDYVFVAGFMAAWKPGDLGGIAPEAKVPPGHLWKGTRIKLETEYLIERKIIPALKAAGTSLENVVKASIYLLNIDDIPAFNEVWRQYFSCSPPATILVPTARPGFAIADATMEINIVALREGGQAKKQVIESRSFTGFLAQPAANRAGNLLFLSGLMAVDHNGPVSSVTHNAANSYLGSTIENQMEYILDVAEAICAASNTNLKNILRVQQFQTNMAEFYPAYQVWRRRFPSLPIPFSAIQVPAPLPVQDCTVMLDLWVYVPPTK